MIAGVDPTRFIVFLPAVGAVAVLGLDLLTGGRPAADGGPARANALAGIRMGGMAALSLIAVWGVLRATGVGDVGPGDPGPALDALGRLAVGFLAAAGLAVVGLSLTHVGLARSRPAEPIALLLLSLSGMAGAVTARDLLGLMLAFELAWLPLVALIALDDRRLSSSESGLKLFFAHVLASLLFAHGVAFVYGATGRLDWEALGMLTTTRPFLLEVGLALVFVGLLARSTVAPFHPWSPDVHEGAPSFVTTYIASAAQATTFVALLRLVHAVEPSGASGIEVESVVSERLATLLGGLACLGLLWGHAMALVQVGLRRLIGWLGVGQSGFLALALVEARDAGGPALLLGLLAVSVASAGALAILSSLSHHGRACEQIGDLSGMSTHSPLRAGLLALFLLSLGGFPLTIGFVARLEILAAVEHGGHRELLVAGLVATVLALTAVGRPLLAMLRPVEATRGAATRALSHEQLVLAVCAACVLYFGIAPLAPGAGVAGWVSSWIEAAVAGLRG